MKDESLGRQDYKPDEMGTNNAFAYQRLTKTPRVTIITAESTGRLTLPQMMSPTYTRVILVRYSGTIREVLPDEYSEWKDSLAEGIYTPITFQWASQDIDGKSQDEFNIEQVHSVVTQVDGSLETLIRQWFAKEVNTNKNSTKTVELVVDLKNYKSPLTR